MHAVTPPVGRQQGCSSGGWKSPLPSFWGYPQPWVTAPRILGAPTALGDSSCHFGAPTALGDTSLHFGGPAALGDPAGTSTRCFLHHTTTSSSENGGCQYFHPSSRLTLLLFPRNPLALRGQPAATQSNREKYFICHFFVPQGMISLFSGSS